MAETLQDAHFAVVVGINRYPGLGDLRGPVGDAGRFVRWLCDPAGGGLPRDNVRLVPASPDSDRQLTREAAQPSYMDINDALHSVNTAVHQRLEHDPSVWERTRLYFFVAGHGMLPEDSDAALFTANASQAVPGYNIELRLYSQWYRRCGCFRELVMFADCCRNQVPGATSLGPPFARCDLVERSVRVAVGYAAEFGRRAFEDVVEESDPDERRGFFTTALLRGLQEPRRWGELRAFVDQTLPELAQDHKRVQRAEMSGDDEIVFGMPGRPAAGTSLTVTILFPDGAPASVDLCDGRLQPIRTWETAQGPMVAELIPGLYYVREHGTNTPVGVPFTVAGADLDVRL